MEVARSGLARVVTSALKVGAALTVAGALACTAPNPAYLRAVVATDAGVPEVPAGGGDAAGERPDDPPDAHSEVFGPDGAGAADLPADGRGDGLAEAGPNVTDAAPADLPGPAAETQAEATSDAAGLAQYLVGYWKFDEQIGVLARDSSPYRHDGEVEGFPTDDAWVTTPRGGGLRLPLDGPVAAGVRVGGTGAPPPAIAGVARFTISAWVRRSGNLGVHQTVMSRQLGDSDREVFGLVLNNDRAILYMAPQTPGDTVQAEAPCPAVIDRWTHVAASYDGAALRVYVDGVAGAPVAHGDGLTGSNKPLYLGTNKNMTARHQPLQGVLDEVMLFSRDLDADTIRGLRDGRISPL